MKLDPEAQNYWNQAFQVLRQQRAKHIQFNIVPRYCGGSPAGLDEETWSKAAADEVEGHKMALTGVLGEERKRLAETKGLKNICYARWEKGRKVWRFDLLTGEVFIEPKRLEYEEIERLKMLRNMKEYSAGIGNLTDEHQKELALLEYRAELHRQDIK